VWRGRVGDPRGMKRRDFLRLSGTFFAAASLPGIAACGDDGGGSSADAGTDASPDALPTGSFLFPQGLASGDPRETSVVLWTRAVPASGTADVALRIEVATDDTFATAVVMQAITATAASDHTVRVVVTGLAADTIYFYRFTAGSDALVGRTRTAPAAGADVPIRMAWVSCQDYAAGQYHAYRQMVLEDAARPEADQIRFVLHLGDWIYETRGDGFQAALDDNFEPITVNNVDGTPRTVPAFPSGGGTAGGSNFATTVEDYRHLYKTIATDPDLQAARARWPFVHTWDDHEFTNDCWQSMANYTNEVGETGVDEPSQVRKQAANQAWFEFLPVQLTGAPGVTGVTQAARDFAAATVSDAPFTAANADNFVPEPNNVAAVGSITIYRSLRFGQHVELIVTDERSYRSDHAVPEEFSAPLFEYFDARNVLPIEDVRIMDAGATANGGNPPATVGKSPNPRRTSPPGTLLGKAQKEWWKASMKMSTATWKLWGNQVPFMRFFIKNTPLANLITDRVMDADAWDGYPTEQRELGTYLRTEDIKNVVLLTGDIHAHFAGVVMDDYAAAAPAPVGVEFISAGVASNSLFSFYESATENGTGTAARRLVTTDTSPAGPEFLENLNLLLLHGTTAAITMDETEDRAMALAQSDPTINPHLKYADTNAQGYGVVLITATQVETVLTTVERPTDNTAGVKRTARFVVPKDNPAGMTGPTFTGTAPFPF
jgi:alkaline phosphatase D